MVLTEQFGAEKLVQRAKNYIKTNFSGAVNDEESIGISEQVLAHFIGLDDIQESLDLPGEGGVCSLVPCENLQLFPCSSKIN